jgi:hypothetical protein
VQKFLGHHSILTTARYTHLTEQAKAKGGYLFNHQALAKVFRAKMLAGIEAAGLTLPRRHPEQTRNAGLLCRIFGGLVHLHSNPNQASAFLCATFSAVSGDKLAKSPKRIAYKMLSYSAQLRTVSRPTTNRSG